jgi:hypothetical protein
LIGGTEDCFFALGEFSVMLGDAEQTACYSIVEFLSGLAGNLRCPLSKLGSSGHTAIQSKEAGASPAKKKDGYG